MKSTVSRSYVASIKELGRVGAISVIDDANVTTLRCISTGTLEGVADITYEIAATALAEPSTRCGSLPRLWCAGYTHASGNL